MDNLEILDQTLSLQRQHYAKIREALAAHLLPDQPYVLNVHYNRYRVGTGYQAELYCGNTTVGTLTIDNRFNITYKEA